MMTQDKIMPTAPEAEEAVIGTVLSFPDSLSTIASIIGPEMFQSAELAAACKVCFTLLQGGSPVDLTIVTTELRKQGWDLAVLLTELSSRIPTVHHLEKHALIVKEKFLLREYVKAGKELENAAYEQDFETVSNIIETTLLGISGKISKKEPRRLGLLVDDAIRIINEVSAGTITLIGVPSGFTKLDRITGGFKKGELTIIAARPSMGKTAIALQLAKNAAELSHPVAFFSLEMSETEIARRFISSASGYTNTELIQGKAVPEELYASTTGLYDANIYIDDTSALSLLELRAKARRLVLKHNIEIVIVDYLQLMSGQGQNREQEISNISRGLKSIAKDLNVPVIALSQLNREAENRSDKRPQLSDLRESGAIEQDADIVWLLYRPAYYQIRTTMVNGEEVNTTGLLLINMAKNRNGVTGERPLHHNQSLTTINEE